MLLHKSIGLEVAAIKTDEARKGFFSGYASTFNGVDTYKDKVLPGAFIKSLSNRTRPVQLKWAHYGPVIGKIIKLEEDETGLYMEGELTPGHSVAEDAYASIKHEAVTGLSIGYTVVRAVQRGDVRELHEINLIEISVVEKPADLAAQIGSVKSALDEVQTLQEIESILRDAGGFSRLEAKAFIAKVKAIGEPRDAEPQLDSDEVKALLAVRANLFSPT